MPSLDAVKRSVREHASGALPPRVPSLLDDCANVLHRPRKARVGNRKLTLAAMVFAVAALAAVVVAGVLATDAATATDFAQKNLAPSPAHPFGWGVTCYCAPWRACPQACSWGCWRPRCRR